MNIILKGQLAFMNQFFEVIGVTSPDEKHFSACSEREGIRMIPVNMQRTISPIKDFLVLWKLYRIFKIEKPQIVHTHTPKAGLLGILAAKLANVPVKMHTVGGMPLTETKGFKRKILSFTEKLTYACADKVYPNSIGLKDIILENNFCPENKLKVIANGSSNGVNTDFFSAELVKKQDQYLESIKVNLGIRENDFIFLFVGRLAQDKGIIELVEAFNRLKVKHDYIKLLLIGPFEQSYSQLDDKVKREIESNTSIIAPGRFDDVRPYYTISNVYVFPSYREGFPNSLMEAGAMGLPIIATDINGCNEIVKHGNNGLLIPPKDSVALGEAMNTCLADKELCIKLKSNARSSIINRFKNELIWEALKKEYDLHLNEVLNVAT